MMVSPVCYSPSTQHRSLSHNRDNSALMGTTPYYQTYSDRRIGGGSGGIYNTRSGMRAVMAGERDSVGHHDSASSSSSGSSSSAQRKRIAVACGRCRKRKIRCSGDTGTGEPCVHCRNAGFEPCQFLRVSSTEAPLRLDGLPFTVDLSKHFQNRSSVTAAPVANPMGHYPDHLQLSSSEVAQYRNGYDYQGRPMYNLGHLPPTGFDDDHSLGYPGYSQSCQHGSEPVYMMGHYRVGPNGGSGPRSHQDIYADGQPAGYDYIDAAAMTGSVASQQAVHRQNISAGCPPLPMHHGSTTSSNSMPFGDRSLPDPRRQWSYSGPRTIRAESILSAYSKHSPSSGASPGDSVSDEAGNYSSMDGSSITNYSACPSVSSQIGHSNDFYAASSSVTSNPGMTGISESANGSSLPISSNNYSAGLNMPRRYLDSAQRLENEASIRGLGISTPHLTQYTPSDCRPQAQYLLDRAGNGDHAHTAGTGKKETRVGFPSP